MVGTVIKVMGRYYTVECGGERYNCALKGKMKSAEDMDRFSNPAAVGDRIEFTWGDDGSGTLNEVYKRQNVFTRRDKGRQREDIIAANIDLVAVIQAFDYPPLNFRFADRILVRAARGGIPALLCVNKADLADDQDQADIEAYYKGAGIEIIFMCAADGTGIDLLKEAILGRQTLMIGTSGVGKSTIVNSIDPCLSLRTAEVSDSTRKGRHTTTNVEMIFLGGKTTLIDTPGMRAFGLIDIPVEELALCFNEFIKPAKKCSYSPCTHNHEPDCEVKRLVEKGKISEGRYISYLNILDSLIQYYETRYR